MLVKVNEVNKEEILTVTSREVAEDFEREHKNVKRDIEKLISEIGSNMSTSRVWNKGQRKSKRLFT